MQWTLKLGGRAAFRWEKLWPSRVAWSCWTASKPEQTWANLPPSCQLSEVNDFDLAASIRWHLRQLCPVHHCSSNPNYLPMPWSPCQCIKQEDIPNLPRFLQECNGGDDVCFLSQIATLDVNYYELITEINWVYFRATEPAWVESIKQWAKTPSTDNLTQMEHVTKQLGQVSQVWSDSVSPHL